MAKIERFLSSRPVSEFFNYQRYGVRSTYLNASGGSITNSGGLRTHIFSTVGSDTFTITDMPNSGTAIVEYLVVAGGGGGGSDRDVGGGGGAGGLLTGIFTVSKTSYSITVGDGGLRGTGVDFTLTGGGTNGSQGGSSVFGSISTVGGGYGGTRNSAGGSGGSGGGGGDNSMPGGSATSGQGYAGGTGPGMNSNGGQDSGGGGGAGGAAALNIPGPGLFNSIGNGTFAAGGRGTQLIDYGNGTFGTGNGGGGIRNGGSGIVVIRYFY
jgi:hypothetical protein